MTRIFMFDERRELFYYVEANFTGPLPPSGRTITLFTIDPTTGATKAQRVQGATNFPTGARALAMFLAAVQHLTCSPYLERSQLSLRCFLDAAVAGYYFHCQLDRIFMATHIVDRQEQPTGYQWFSIDPTTARATLLSTVRLCFSLGGSMTEPHTDGQAGCCERRLGGESLFTARAGWLVPITPFGCELHR